MADFPYNSVLHHQVYLMFKAVLLDSNRDTWKAERVFANIGNQITETLTGNLNTSEPVAYTEPYKAYLRLIYDDWYTPIVPLTESARERNRKAVAAIDENDVMAQIISEFNNVAIPSASV